MHLATNINTLATIDTSRKEYVDFKSAILGIDWTPSSYITPSNNALAYAPGVVFANIPFVNDHPAHKQSWGQATTGNIFQTQQFKKLWDSSIPLFSYIEELVPNHRIVKAEILATKPHAVNNKAEVERIHLDGKKFHKLATRCQIAFLSNPDCFLFVEDSKINVTEGTIFEFNNRLCHWGVNWGTTLKVCLVVDMIDLAVWNKLSDHDRATFFDIDVTKEEIKYMINFKQRRLNGTA